MAEFLGDHIFRTQLNRKLIAELLPVDYDGAPLADAVGVAAMVINEGNLNIQPNWQNPFESMGPESKAPAIAAMIQSGAIAPLTQMLKQFSNDAANTQNNDSAAGRAAAGLFDLFGTAANRANDAVLAARGRTGVTKLNSTQFFSGMAPTKLNFTLLFKAYKSPLVEVMQPLQELMKWAVPRQLSKDGLVIGALTNSNQQAGLLNNLLPSLSPTIISMTYGNWTLPPMVIESLEIPITSPRDAFGDFIEVAVPITLGTLTGQDSRDIDSMFRGQNRF